MLLDSFVLNFVNKKGIFNSWKVYFLTFIISYQCLVRMWILNFFLKCCVIFTIFNLNKNGISFSYENIFYFIKLENKL